MINSTKKAFIDCASLMKKIKIRKCPAFLYYCLNSFFWFLTVVVHLSLASIFLIVLLLVYKFPIFNEAELMDDINFSINFFAIALTFFAVAIAVLSFVFSRKDESIFGKNTIRMMFGYRGSFGFTIPFLLGFSMIYLILCIISILFSSPKNIIGNSICLITHMLIMCSVVFEIITFDINKLYYIYIRNFDPRILPKRICSSHGNYPHKFKFVSEESNFKISFFDFLETKETAQTKEIIRVLDYVIEQTKFDNLSKTEEQNLLFLLDQYFHNVYSQNGLLVSTLILDHISYMNQSLILLPDKKLFYLINLTTLNGIKSIMSKSFIKDYLNEIINKEELSKLFNALTTSKHTLSKYSNLIDEYLNYKKVSFTLLKRADDKYVSNLIKIIPDDNRFVNLRKISDEISKIISSANDLNERKIFETFKN